MTHWHALSPGRTKTQFIYCLPGAVEHIGRESTWQGYYDDELEYNELMNLRTLPLYDIIHKYPPRHTYLSDKYWYETISDNEFLQKSGNVNTKKINELKFDINDHNTYPDLGSGNILAFNYIWPKYSLSFLELSITQALKFVDKYFLILHTKSYIGNPAPLNNILSIVDLCSKYKDKVILKINDTLVPERCKQNNIAYHYEQLLSLKDKLNYNYLILIQSDELYDDDQINSINHFINNYEHHINGGYITNPICYINSPNWRVQPKEDFRRLSIVALEDIKYKNIKYENIELFKSNIDFHHMSYVLSQQELTEKFTNWGHRNDITVDKLSVFLSKFDKAKTDKTVKNLHPIIPEIYDHLEYVNTSFNNDCFLKYIQDIDNINYSNLIGSDFAQTVFKSNDQDNLNTLNLSQFDKKILFNIIQTLLPSNPRILILNHMQNSWISSFISKCKQSDIYTITPYVSENIKEYNFGIKQSLKYKFKLFAGQYKTVSAFPNNYFDLIFYSFDNNNDLLQYYIESWPKIKNFGLVLGINNNLDIINNLLSSHIETCPWGNTKFDYYETWYNLLNIDKSITLWFARVKKEY